MSRHLAALFMGDDAMGSRTSKKGRTSWPTDSSDKNFSGKIKTVEGRPFSAIQPEGLLFLCSLRSKRHDLGDTEETQRIKFKTKSLPFGWQSSRRKARECQGFSYCKHRLHDPRREDQVARLGGGRTT